MVVRNLIKLLDKEGSVYVNEIGLFQKVFYAAEIEKDNIIPPHYGVILDTQAEGSGYHFLTYLSQQESLLMLEADAAIRHWREAIQEELRMHKKAMIVGFGTFSIKKNRLTFDCAYVPELNAEFEGYHPLKIAVQKSYPAPVNEVKVLTEDVSTEETSTENISTENTSTEEPATENISTENISTEEPATENISTENISTENTSTEEPATENISTENTSIEEPSTEEISTEEISTENTSTEETSTEETSTENISTENTSTEEPATENPSTEEGATEVPIEDTVEDIESKDEGMSDVKKHRKHTDWWIFIGVLIVALGVLCYLFAPEIKNFYTQYFEKYFGKSEDTLPMDTVQDTVSKCDTIAMMDTLFIDRVDSTEDDRLDNDTEEQVATTVRNKDFDINKLDIIQYDMGKYYVVHGSFCTEADCAKHIVQHHFESYNPTIIQQHNVKRLRVCLGVFASEELADQFIAQNEIKDAWILK